MHTNKRSSAKQTQLEHPIQNNIITDISDQHRNVNVQRVIK